LRFNPLLKFNTALFKKARPRLPEIFSNMEYVYGMNGFGKKLSYRFSEIKFHKNYIFIDF